MSIALIVILLGIGYGLLKRLKGIEAVLRLLSSNLTRFLIVIFIIAIFRLVFGAYGYIAAWLFLTVFSILWIGSWPLRKLNAGKIISNTRKPKLLKSVVSSNLLLLCSGAWLIPAIWSGIWLASKTIPKGYLVNPLGLAIYLSMATLLFLPPYLPIFEGPTFRANGICYQYKFIPWDRIDSYSTDALSQGVLLLRWQPTIPIYSQVVRLPITSGQLNLVINLLCEHLKS